MNTHPDFEELLRLLEEHHVDDMIVGGYAVDLGAERRSSLGELSNESPPVGFRRSSQPIEAFVRGGAVTDDWAPLAAPRDRVLPYVGRA